MRCGRLLGSDTLTRDRPGGRGVHARRLDPACPGDHIDRLYRAAGGMCISREEAEDLVEDTLARAYKEPRVLHPDEEIGHLFRVLRTTFLIRRRFAQRRRAFPARVDELASIEDLSAAWPDARLDYPDLYRAVAFLPDDFRDALIAIDLMGLSYGEAASALCIPEATVATRLHRGRQRGAEMLDTESVPAVGVRRANAER